MKIIKQKIKKLFRTNHQFMKVEYSSTSTLNKLCKKYGCDPSSLEGQVRYMINENQFQKVLPSFEGRGNSISQYMVPAYYWLGWGIKGNREYYSYNYTKRMVYS